MPFLPEEMGGSNSSDGAPTVDSQNHADMTSPSPSFIPFDTISIPPCEWILSQDVPGSSVRIWDLIILIPNCLFLLFLLVYMRSAIAKLQSSSSPIFNVFFGLVVAVSCISVLRCIVSMTVKASVEAGEKTDKTLWLLLRFFLLATEMSVVIFGLAFGHLDSRTSIQRVLLVTFSFALIYSVIQGALEFEYDHPVFSSSSNSTKTSYDLFAHGGMIFLFTSSVIYSLIYVGILILPFTALKERFQLPTKKIFYYYCGFLATLNLSQAVAALLLYLEHRHSLCVIDVTTYIYFTFYDPLVYCVFLWKFFWSKDNGVQFSYKHHEDLEEDQLSLPYSGATTNAKPDDHAPIFSYDSTHFDVYFSQSHEGGPNMSINNDLPSPS